MAKDNTNHSTVIILSNDGQQTRSFEVPNKWINLIKPSIIGLSIASSVLAISLAVLSYNHFSTSVENKNLKDKVTDLHNYKSLEVNSKINQLEAAEKVIQQVEQYVAQRELNSEASGGASAPSEKPQAVGGEYYPKNNSNVEIANVSSTSSAKNGANATNNSNNTSIPDSSRLQSLYQKIRQIPLGHPHDGELTSRFGNRSNPFNGHGEENHHGLDFRGTIGEPIKSTADGEVVHAGPLGGYGNAVKIKHGFGYLTLYGHMTKVNVEVGQKISAGEVVGLLGSTGRSTGPHLHYEVQKDDVHLDPENFLSLNASTN